MTSTPARDGGGEPPGSAEHSRVPRVLVPWQLVTVAGPSMVPTLRPGDRLLVRRGAAVRVGDVVLARFDDLPGVLVVKRVAARTSESDRAVLARDNDAAGGDSRTHGPGLVLGRGVLVRHGRRWRRVPPAL